MILNACGSLGCTSEFAFYTLTVRDGSGAAVLLDSITVTNLETNETYPDCNAGASTFPCLNLSPSEGDFLYPSYEVMNDSFNEILKRSGTRILVEGTKGNLTFSEEYVFSSDPCHVNLESGSLEITLE